MQRDSGRRRRLLPWSSELMLGHCRSKLSHVTRGRVERVRTDMLGGVGALDVGVRCMWYATTHAERCGT